MIFQRIRLARLKGFQDADARELVQEVLLAVAKAVHRWQPDNNRGRFRDWFFRIARNHMINFMTRKKHQSIANGNADFALLLIDPTCEQSALFDLEYGRQMFLWATDRVRDPVTSNTWHPLDNEELASERYQKLSTDKDGNIVFPLLIPDAQYVLYTYNAGQDRMFFKERKRFKVAAGERIDLGTILTVRK